MLGKFVLKRCLFCKKRYPCYISSLKSYEIKESKLNMTIPEEKWKAYRQSAKRREEEERRNLKLRFQKAWRVARLASTFLNKNFGARKVFVFGSLLNEELFHLKSDIDVAVMGLDEKDYYRAQGQLLALDPEFEIDLILMEDVPENPKKKIDSEGIEI